MPALRNARQERFAQALALGLAPHEAYERAGYTPGVRAAAAAARLQNSTTLKARIAELTARAAGTGRPRTGALGVTASARSTPHTATSNGATANGAAASRTTASGARSNGAGTGKSARSGPERGTASGASPDGPVSDTAAPDNTATENSSPAVTPPTEAAPASVASLIDELEEARQLAIEIKQPAAAVSATMSKARISGLIGEKTDAKPGHGPVEMSDIEMARRMALLLARGLRDMPDEVSH